MSFDMEDADPVAVVLRRLLADEAITAALGGPNQVSGVLEEPWPHIIVDHGPSFDTGQSAARTEVRWEVVGSPAGFPSKSALRRIAVMCLWSIRGLVNQPAEPGQPVVSLVTPSGTLAWSPMTNGQPRWVSGAFVTLHPPQF